VSDHVGRAFAVHWSEVKRWDPSSFEKVDWSWPDAVMAPIGSVLTQRKQKVDRAKYAFTELQPLSVHFDGSVSKRKVADDREYTMELWFAKPGDIVVAKIDLKNGAVGIVPPDWENVAVTGHFAVYEPIHDRMLPEFFHLIIQAPFFKAHLNRNKVGAEGRKEVKLDFFESEKIPVPPLATQRAIVAHWQATQEKNAAALKAADEHEADIRREFLEKLGLSDRTQVITQRAFALRWTEINRWSVEFIRQSSDDLEPDRGRYPVVKLGDVIADLSNGWSPQCLSRPAEGSEWGVLKLGAVSLGSFNPDQNKALPPSLAPESALEIKPGDVLISRANITRLVGACAHVLCTPPRLLLCDKIFRVVPKANPPITPEYIAEVLKLPHLRRQIESSVTGSSPTMKNITKPALLGLRIPLPPLSIQKQLVAEVTTARTRIAAERAAAAKLAADTAREVEAMILGQLPAPAFH